MSASATKGLGGLPGFAWGAEPEHNQGPPEPRSHTTPLRLLLGLRQLLAPGFADCVETTQPSLEL